MSKTPTPKPEEWVPHQQRWRVCDGHMEREPGRLQLRVALRGHEGICSVLFEEDDHAVTVLILVCGVDDDPRGEYIGCPTHIYLDAPLGDRAVLDLARERRPVPYRDVLREIAEEFGLEYGGETTLDGG